MTIPVLFAIVFLAALLQTTSGFGFALMAMPLVALVIGVKAAAPLVALVGFTLYAVNLVRYRRGLDWRVLLPLAVAAALGVPLGVWALGNLDEHVVKTVLGVILIAYGLYSLWRPHTAPLRSDLWAYPAGFLAGVLGGAFNTPGPPVIIYGNLRQWSRDLFRSTLPLQQQPCDPLTHRGRQPDRGDHPHLPAARPGPAAGRLGRRAHRSAAEQ